MNRRCVVYGYNASTFLVQMFSSPVSSLRPPLQEILLMKQRVEEMEREAKKLRELQAAAESSTNVEQVEGEEAMPMETEDEKALIDNRSVFVGNVRDLSLLIGTTIDHLTFHRLTIAQQPKISRHTFKPAVPLTVSPSSVTSSQAILKGT